MDKSKVWYASKTMLFGVATAVAPAALEYVAGVDWTQFGLNPAMGAAIGLAVMGLRGFTKAPVTLTSK